ncbi:hypothetical protein [Allopontixanthobacter sp.]|uniref:hypothetical protein n=1 Tax=Allopontixanthobacter sp. TaxID=2906452 RepID=UPI002AB94CF3|nr:hypothetical protein [Allopontixanthobacter sp.]MDZ4307595.1 hypothetical protein [Allopontixanthobacter sp.]
MEMKNIGLAATDRGHIRPAPRLWAGWLRVSIALGLAIGTWSAAIYLIDAIAL